MVVLAYAMVPKSYVKHNLRSLSVIFTQYVSFAVRGEKIRTFWSLSRDLFSFSLHTQKTCLRCFALLMFSTPQQFKMDNFMDKNKNKLALKSIRNMHTNVTEKLQAQGNSSDKRHQKISWQKTPKRLSAICSKKRSRRFMRNFEAPVTKINISEVKFGRKRDAGAV